MPGTGDEAANACAEGLVGLAAGAPPAPPAAKPKATRTVAAKRKLDEATKKVAAAVAKVRSLVADHEVKRLKSGKPSDLFEPPPASVFAQDPPHAFAYSYDATAAMAMALLEPYRDPPRLVDTNASAGTRTLHALRGLEFDGASGSVRFFENGDRDNGGLELVIFEWLNVSNTIERVPVARLGLASNFTDVIHIPTDVALAGQWPGGRIGRF